MAAKRPKKTVPKVKNPPQGPNPWDIAPLLPKGDAEATPIWTAVGKALTVWERLDGVLADIFGVMVGSRGGAATAALGIIGTSSTRAEMLNVAGAIVLQKDATLLSALKSITRRAGYLSSRRNDIAHGVVGHFVEGHTDEHGAVTEVDHGHYLTPATYATRKRSNIERQMGDPMMLDHVYAYTSEQVEDYGIAFLALYREAVQLMFIVKAYVEVRWPIGEHLPRDRPASFDSPPEDGGSSPEPSQPPEPSDG
jgi:hypothetical protein